MKDIQKALEKARQGHSSAGARRFTDAPPPPKPANEPELGVQYRETRTEAPCNNLLENQRVVAGFNYHQLNDTFRVLRTRVLHRLEYDDRSTLAITSPGRGEGKTLTAINFSISVALKVTRTVLLVDIDLRSPKMHRYLGIENSPGLCDYLAGTATLSQCLVNPGIDRLVVLPAGGPVTGSSELLSSPRMVNLASELKSRYSDRLIVYDFPPVLASDDALAFIHHVDSCLLVVEDGGTSKRDLKQTLNLLQGVPIVGTVLNKAKAPPKHVYYEYA